MYKMKLMNDFAQEAVTLHGEIYFLLINICNVYNGIIVNQHRTQASILQINMGNFIFSIKNSSS